MADTQLRKKVRRRKVNSVRTVPQVESMLKDSMDEAANIMGQIEGLIGILSEYNNKSSDLMAELNITKFQSDKGEATYEHPKQTTVNSIDAEGLFEDVAVEDFLASVKIQKGLAEKVVDPKILSKHTTTTKSSLKPKTFKLKPRK